MRNLDLLREQYNRCYRRHLLLGQHFVTTPTSIVNRLMGVEPSPDPMTFSGLATFSGGINSSGAFQNQALPLLAIAAGTTTLALSPATHAGKIVTLSSTGGLTVTPPAATGTGNVYTFGVTTTLTGGSFTFDAKAGNASDLIFGSALTNKVGTGPTSYGTIASTNLITWNGGTTGGIKGDWMQLIDLATNIWLVEIVGQQSGTVATPFSNH